MSGVFISNATVPHLTHTGLTSGPWREQLLLALLHAFSGPVSDHSVASSSLLRKNGDGEGTDGNRWRVRSGPPVIRTWQQESFCWGSGHPGSSTFEPFQVCICVCLSCSVNVPVGSLQAIYLAMMRVYSDA